MADQRQARAASRPGPTPPIGGGATTRERGFIQRLQEHAPNSTQVIGLLTLVISGAILLLLTGLTLAATTVGLIVITPLVLLSSPVWIPVLAFLGVAASGFVAVTGFGLAVLGGLTWMYRYIKGRHPVGSDRVDYARMRLTDTASQMKDYARDYRGYLQGKVKDAAPGA
ncbi:hypothetical protein AMTRI_Chr13g84790 [Amborella trichopoda]|uniref:Oleosin n=1 Tax=Amborella trichopoda TaxID=13333 RepID=W1P9K6_AMBTC|nr:oleosin 16 kDa [Amborella trichopoda]ERN04364.1 hypothetical protein AMTR_s00147p00069460 [Amborella trichopoda]|eukprot:XP_006842689.1 oleosin 16 kDa [Amborella trichopoda]